MPKVHIRSTAICASALNSIVAQFLNDQDVSAEFSPQALSEAQQAAKNLPLILKELPDRTSIPFVTIDPEGSRDLDQALAITRTQQGYRIFYAIAALSLFVTPGGALDAEAHARGTTIYLPTGSIPLHPIELSHGAASLLPHQDRASYLWTHTLDSKGNLLNTHVELARIHSRAQLTYTQIQTAIDGDCPDFEYREVAELLKEVGTAREILEIERGGISLELPEQEIKKSSSGYTLEFRQLTKAENWNAQISLLTGMAAAQLMLQAGIGILRTLPPAHNHDLSKLRHIAHALQFNWRRDVEYPDFLRSLDTSEPRTLAFMNNATTLFRGASYLVVPTDSQTSAHDVNYKHGAMNTEYTHVTAPLRRLVDRYALEICRCICAGIEVPQWVLAALPDLPRTMQRTSQKASALENRTLSAMEALTLEGKEGSIFDGVVLEARNDGKRGDVMITDPAVQAAVYGSKLPVGERVKIKLREADPHSGTVIFDLA